MSRCYPFPPPGFVPNRVRDESLIEPIKKGTKEETKREKKDRKHNKDKKRKHRDSESGRNREHLHHKRRRKDESSNANKKVDDDNELQSLEEKSCLTMEEPENQSSSQTSCENEGPNHIQSRQPFDGRHNNGSETSIRVSSHGKGQQKYPEVMMMMTNKDQKQSSSREKLDSSQFSMQLGKEKGASPSHHQESIGPSKLCSKCPPSTAMRFLKLIENWAPHRFFETNLTDSEDQERWLLTKVGAKRHHRQVSVRTSSKGGSSSMVWATAQFLPEAELHALPFTVPF